MLRKQKPKKLKNTDRQKQNNDLAGSGFGALLKVSALLKENLIRGQVGNWNIQLR
jgi:hypothetical protein